MKPRWILTWAAAVGCVFATAVAEEYDYYKHLRYSKDLVPGVGRDKVEQDGGPIAAGYWRRTVQWWPRKGQDIVDIPEGAPLRVWTRNNGNRDAAVLAGLGRNWLTSQPETFQAHLIGLRGFGTSTDIPGNLHPYTPMAVLRMENGEQRAVLDCGPVSWMLSNEDNEFIHSVWEEVYPRLHATVSQDEYVTQTKHPPGGHYTEMPLELWTEAAPRFNAMEPPKKGAKYPRWGERDGSLVFETRHYHFIARPELWGNPANWIRPDDVERQTLYRKCVLEFAENFWTYVEAAGASMPYRRLPSEHYKYVVLVRGSGYGGGGGWMHCGVGDCRPNILGHELFHSMANGGWDGYFLETMCDAGQHTAVPGQLHMFHGNFSYPWRNVNRIAYKSSLWCFVLGDNPNWGYGIQTVLGSLASPAESTPYHTVARLGQNKGLWKNGVRGFGDFFGQYAARMVTCDFVEQLLVRSKYGMPPLSYVHPVYGQENRYRISGAQAPRWCGYNIVRLVPTAGAKEIAVDFHGIHDPAQYSDWRACIVAVDGSGRARYSPLWNKGEMRFALEPHDTHLWLTVAGTPSGFPTLESPEPRGSWGQMYLTGVHAPRYPWEVTLTGCEPGSPHRRQGDVVSFDDLYGMCDGGRNFRDLPVKQEVPIPLTEAGRQGRQPGTDRRLVASYRSVAVGKACQENKLSRACNAEGMLAQEKLEEMLLRIEAAAEALTENGETNPRGRPRTWVGEKRAVLKDLADRAKFLQRSAAGHRHGNGGGFVSDDSRVAETAYVGPRAMVLGGARVEENACIKEYAVVLGPQTVIAGNAKVGGKAWVFGNIEVSGDARILEAATVSTTSNSRSRPGNSRVRIHGSAVIKGDPYVRLGGSDQTITGGVVIDYLPSLDVSDDGVFQFGRFCLPPARLQKISLSDGEDAGALYANWQFNQPQAVTLEDSYVNNNGVLYGGPRFVDDDGHQCIVFNGQDQYAQAPPSVADFGELTVDMLVKRAADDAGRLFDFGTGEGECFYLATEGKSGKPILTAHHNGRSHVIRGREGIPLDKWTRLRVEMDGLTASIHVDGKQVARQDFALSPREVFIPDRPEGNFIACGRNKDEFFQGRMDHFRIYRKVHDEFDALQPAPVALTQMQERPEDDEAAGSKIWSFQQRLRYHTAADWEDRTPEEVSGKAPPKMKEWLIQIRGY